MILEIKEDFIPTLSGISLFYRYFSFSKDIGSPAVVIVHGLGEHSGRYGLLRDLFLKKGYSILLMDLQGHGRSGGKRGHIQDFSYYLEDLYRLIHHLHLWKPLLIGHSMGGLIALRFAQTYPKEISGLVLSAPFLGTNREIPRWKVLLAHYLSLLFPSFTLPTGLNPDHLSHDVEKVKHYLQDPLVHRQASARWFTEIQKAQKKAFEEVGRLEMPILFQLAGDDLLCSTEVSQRLFANIPNSRKEQKVYSGFYHEIYNEVHREVPLQDLFQWIENLKNHSSILE